MRSFSKSKQEFSRAKRVLAGGVNSPVRSFQAMGGTPLVFKKAKGAYLFDVDGHKYIDYCQSWGALALGHADPSVCRAIAVQAGLGTSFGAVTPYETQLATFLRRLFPSCQRLRFVSSGTEAVMSAVRLARGVTGKERILKFEGCYHGHLDSLLVRAGSGLATLGRPSSLGVPSSFVSKTTTLPYNDSNAVKQAFRKFKDIACVIVEPVAGNMGVIPAKRAFLKLLRQETRRHKALLIFDEVMTGLRAHSRGVQGLYGIQPDLTTLGKVIGGGLPIGALGGKEKIMNQLAPEGPVYQAGTLSGNPLSMAAGLETLRQLTRNGTFKKLQASTAYLAGEVESIMRKKGIPVHVPHVGSMFSIYFQPKAPEKYSDISQGHVQTYKKFFWHMVSQGIYLPPSSYEAMFLSVKHSQRDLKTTLKAVERFAL